MKTQKVFISVILIFAGIILFAKNLREEAVEKLDIKIPTEVVVTTKLVAKSNLKVVWNNNLGQEVASKKKALLPRDYTKKHQYTYNFETNTIEPLRIATMEVKKVWYFQPNQ